MPETKIRMLDEPSSSNTCDWNSNPLNLAYENLKNIYPKRVYLAAKDNKDQSCLEEVNAIQERRGFELLNNTRIINTDRNGVVKQQKCTANKTSTRTVPNILKNNLRSHRASQTAPAKTDVAQNSAETSVQFLINSTVKLGSSLLKNESMKRESKRKRLSHRRKQEHNYTGVWQDLPNWNMYSLLDEENGVLNTSLCTLPDLEASKQGKKLKRHVKKQNGKHRTSALKSEWKKDSLPPISRDLSMNSDLSELRTVPSFQETEPKDSQDPIDFTSNEIFSKYNYECHGTNKLDCFADCIMVCNETCDSLGIIHQNDAQKGYDMNGNEIDAQKPARRSSTRNEQNEEDPSTSQTLISSEYWSEDVPVLCDKSPNCSSDLCCGYCQEDCVSHWITTSGAQNVAFTKNKVLAEALNENLINECGNADNRVDIRRSDLHGTWSDEYSTDDTLKEENADNSITVAAEVYPQCALENNIELLLLDLRTTYNEGGVEKNIFGESTSTAEGRGYELLDDSNDISLLQSDPDLLLYISQEEMENTCIIDVSQDEANKQYNANNEEFQCLLCPLTFSSARTMAMHQAGAHGGMYVILCESCGRLFNRKYHFNRHFIHCGRLKEPYKCDMCMRKYRHKSSLVQHLKMSHHVHYTRNRSTTFVCSVCKKMYSKFGAFENHVKRHKKE